MQEKRQETKHLENHQKLKLYNNSKRKKDNLTVENVKIRKNRRQQETERRKRLLLYRRFDERWDFFNAWRWRKVPNGGFRVLRMWTKTISPPSQNLSCSFFLSSTKHFFLVYYSVDNSDNFSKPYRTGLNQSKPIRM